MFGFLFQGLTESEGLGTLLESARTRFPLDFNHFVNLCIALANASSDSASQVEFLCLPMSSVSALDITDNQVLLSSWLICCKDCPSLLNSWSVQLKSLRLRSKPCGDSPKTVSRILVTLLSFLLECWVSSTHNQVQALPSLPSWTRNFHDSIFLRLQQYCTVGVGIQRVWCLCRRNSTSRLADLHGDGWVLRQASNIWESGSMTCFSLPVMVEDALMDRVCLLCKLCEALMQWESEIHPIPQLPAIINMVYGLIQR